MVQKTIVDYIFSQVKLGKSIYQVRDFLISSGYDSSEVESSVEYVLNLWKNPQIAQQQRVQQLIYYINQQIAAGYPIQTIRQFLISKGYPYSEVQSAFNQIQEPKTARSTEHKLLLVALIMMIGITGVLSFFYVSSFLSSGVFEVQSLLDVKSEQISSLQKPGGELVFKVDLINLGESQKFDVELKYSVIDKKSDKTILEKSESVAIITSTQRAVVFDLPDSLIPGDYILRTDAIYNNQTATSGFLFDVKPVEQVEQIIEDVVEKYKESENETNIVESDLPELTDLEFNQTTKLNESINESVNKSTNTQPVELEPELDADSKPEKEDILKGKNKQESFEIITQVSVRNPNRAIEMCGSFAYTQTTNDCLLELSNFKKDSSFCEKIVDTTKQGNCILNYAMESKDYESCNKISDLGLKTGCLQLKMMGDIQTAAESGNSKSLYDSMDKIKSSSSLKDKIKQAKNKQN